MKLPRLFGYPTVVTDDYWRDSGCFSRGVVRAKNFSGSPTTGWPGICRPLGVLQPVADGLKLVFKEDVVPAKTDPWLFTLGPALVVIPVFLSYLIVPFGQNLVITDLNVGIFLWISLSSIAPIGLLMSGYSSNNKYALLGDCVLPPNQSATKFPWPWLYWRSP